MQRQVSRKYQMNKKGESYCKTSNLVKSEKRLFANQNLQVDRGKKSMQMCTGSLVGSLSLWSIILNVSSLLLAATKTDAKYL